MEQGHIREGAFRELVAVQSVKHVTLLGQPGGFALEVCVGEYRRRLATARGALRVFGNLNTAALYLQAIGVDRFEVDSSAFRRGRLRKPRPDRAEALRQTRTRPQQGALL
jgi:hypothetical protein